MCFGERVPVGCVSAGCERAADANLGLGRRRPRLRIPTGVKVVDADPDFRLRNSRPTGRYEGSGMEPGQAAAGECPSRGRIRVRRERGLGRWVTDDGHRRAMALGRGIYRGLSWTAPEGSLLTNIQRWISLAAIRPYEKHNPDSHKSAARFCRTTTASGYDRPELATLPDGPRWDSRDGVGQACIKSRRTGSPTSHDGILERSAPQCIMG